MVTFLYIIWYSKIRKSSTQKKRAILGSPVRCPLQSEIPWKVCRWLRTREMSAARPGGTIPYPKCSVRCPLQNEDPWRIWMIPEKCLLHTLHAYYWVFPFYMFSRMNLRSSKYFVHLLIRLLHIPLSLALLPWQRKSVSLELFLPPCLVFLYFLAHHPNLFRIFTTFFLVGWCVL